MWFQASNKSRSYKMIGILLGIIFCLSPLYAQEDKPFSIPEGLSQIKILHQEGAQFPEIAKKYFTEAKVDLEVVIGKDGKVKSAEVKNVTTEVNETVKKEVLRKLKNKQNKQNEENEDILSSEARQEKLESAFKDAAMAAVMKWTFEPIKSDGKAISIKYPVHFEFSMEPKKDEQQKKKNKVKNKAKNEEEGEEIY